ncbi:acyl-CoA synthetase [Lacibacterium aquatile]|uniref:Acyl-CoA synthetase n=1 Tax=Lacibacterium aquatile TaxID=1168082 RepID=A0ABW5DR45_9PROT
MLPLATSYEDLTRNFRWQIPARYNMAAHCLKNEGLALIEVASDGSTTDFSYSDLGRLSARLANVLAAAGLTVGDRLGILLSQGSPCAVSHLAAYRSGLIALPLFGLFGPEALEYRLADSGASAVVTDMAGLVKLEEIRGRLPALKAVFVVGLGKDIDNATRDYDSTLAEASDFHTILDTAADDPAVIIYTSGTTGQPKGALHAQRVLLGHLPGVEMPHHFFPQVGDRFWTPADWAWIGGLFDVLMPALASGVPLIAQRMAKFEPDRAFDLIERFQVKNLFLPPTALKLMRQSSGMARNIRTVASGGESLGAELLDWGRATFGKTINEFYGQTECNLVVGNDAELFPVVPGAMGRAIPGHTVAVIDGEGREVADGEPGLIAIRRPDPVMFLGYWGKPEATAQKFIGDWLVTGDQGWRDEAGYLHFQGRDDDIITSGGYRIGPAEIEDCLLKHPAVAMCAVVGKPDPIRTEIVKAFVVLKPGAQALAPELQDFVKTRLAAHEYPREVEFLDNLPMTATGKIIRRELRGR